MVVHLYPTIFFSTFSSLFVSSLFVSSLFVSSLGRWCEDTSGAPLSEAPRSHAFTPPSRTTALPYDRSGLAVPLSAPPPPSSRSPRLAPSAPAQCRTPPRHPRPAT